MSEPTMPQIPPTPIPPTPAAAPKKSNPIVKIALGCLGLIVLGCVGFGGLLGYGLYQQNQSYETGHAAYLKGDCAAAIDPLTKAASGDPGSPQAEAATKAQADLQECEAFLEADNLAASDPGAAVLGYAAFVEKYTTGPLIEPATTKAQELLSTGNPEELAVVPLCEVTDALVDQKYIANPDETLPPLLFACGQTYETENEFSAAVFTYARFREDYPDHPLAADVEEAYVRASLAEANAVGAGNIPAPQAIGETGTTGEMTVIIQNDSPDKLSLIFSGPEVRVEELEPCADCIKYTGDGPDACPEQGPIGTYVLKPGSYQVVVKSTSGESVTPFQGTWDLADGQEYYSCFFLVTR